MRSIIGRRSETRKIFFDYITWPFGGKCKCAEMHHVPLTGTRRVISVLCIFVRCKWCYARRRVLRLNGVSEHFFSKYIAQEDSDGRAQSALTALLILDRLHSSFAVFSWPFVQSFIFMAIQANLFFWLLHLLCFNGQNSVHSGLLPFLDYITLDSTVSVRVKSMLDARAGLRCWEFFKWSSSYARWRGYI